MFGKKKEEPVVSKTKKVYDFENDKSKGLLNDALNEVKNDGAKIKNEIPMNKLPEVDEEDFENDVSNVDERELRRLTEFKDETPTDVVKKIKHFIMFLFLFLVFIFIIVAIWATNSKVFELKNIIVENGKFVSSGEITNIVKPELGKNLFLINTAQLKKKIEENSNIYFAKVKRVFLDSLEVSFIERTPRILLESGEQKLVLDQYGSILGINGDIQNDLVRTEFGMSKNYNVGETLTGTDIVKYNNILFLLDMADEISFEYKISRIWYDNSEDINMYIEDAQIEVLYGTLNKMQADDKMLYLKEVIKKAKSQNLTGYLNMSSEDYHKSVLNSNI